MFAYIKLVDEDKYDTIPFTWVKNYDQVKLPVNRNKQHYILYENQPPKKALLLFVEDTIDVLEKQIKSKRITVLPPRNQETATELSDTEIDESSAKNKTTSNVDINPVVNQQLEQLKAKLAAISNGTEVHDNLATKVHDNNDKENSKFILNHSKDHENVLKEVTTPPKTLHPEKLDLLSMKIEKKSKEVKKRKRDPESLMETMPNKNLRNSIIEKTTSYLSHDGGSRQVQNNGSMKSTGSVKLQVKKDDKSITVTKSDAHDILPDGLPNRDIVEGNKQKEIISEEHDNDQLSQTKISGSQEVDPTVSEIAETPEFLEQINLIKDSTATTLNANNTSLESGSTKTVLEESATEQDDISCEPFRSFDQPVNESLKKKKKSKLSDKKPKRSKSSKKSKIKNQRNESENGVMNEVRQEINDIKKSQEAFQQVVTAALQTILSNWQQIQSTRATVPTAVQAIDFENIQVPPPVGFIRTDTEMIHCGQNVWITVQDYNNAKAAAGTDAIFVKNIAVNIFTRDVLKISSITGKRSNRTKGPAKPKLDPIKMLAVRGIYRHYLKEHRQLSEKHINEKIDDYVEYIRGKISDLERPKKIPLKKTEKEEANEIEKKGDGKRKRVKPESRKKKFLAPVTIVVLVKKVLILRVKLVAMKTPLITKLFFLSLIF
ncbi:uncharacterized protein LOC141527600 [Cotesia typhae]|uniref:uncharacterized protein LOC141527600 n=1 Tax=Cotesia typhae TaxID=2053667 RepID=UPI003D697E82